MPNGQIELGAGPCEEQLASLGQDDYIERSKRECAVYNRMLLRLHPIPDGAKARLKVSGFRHDFGTYRESVVEYDLDDGVACDYAYDLESNGPLQWDNIARYELWWFEEREKAFSEVARGERQSDAIRDAFRSNQLPALNAEMSLAQLMAAHPV